MDSSQRSGFSLPGWIGIFVAFIIGFFIGLVMFGWWLTPVVWEDGSFEVLNPALQQEFLQASIDSYAYRQDDALAIARYEALGSQKETVLAAVAADPQSLNAQDIERFASAVGASEVIKNPPEAAEPVDPNAFVSQRLITNPLIIGAGLCLMLSIIGIAVVGIVLATSRRDEKPKSNVTEEVPPAAPIADQEDEVGGETAPSPTEGGFWESETGTPPPSDIDPYQTVRIEEESLAQVFDSETPADFGVTPPRGMDLETMTPIEGGPETELSDEDFAELESQTDEEDRSGAAAAAAVFATAFMDEPGAQETTETEQPGTEDDFSWLQTPADETGDDLGWLGVAAAAEPSEPTPEEIAPFEMETPANVEAQADADEVIEVDLDDTPDEAFTKFSQDIASLNGIGDDYGQELKAAGITTPLLLLRNGASREGRLAIAQDTGLSEELVLHWVHYADLMRVQGLNHEFASLLQSVGIESMEGLAQSESQSLYERLRAGVEITGHPNRIPSLRSIESWISQARRLPQTVVE